LAPIRLAWFRPARFYYRPGTAEQSAAATLASEFGLRSEPRFSGIEDATPGLIVIVTNDYQRRK
jgi:hypothetical protein